MKKLFILCALVLGASPCCGAATRVRATTWKHVNTKGIKFVDISVVGKNNMWGLDANGNIYRWDGAAWAKRPHKAPFKEMSVGNDGSVFAVDELGKVFTDMSTTVTTIDNEIQNVHSKLRDLQAKRVAITENLAPEDVRPRMKRAKFLTSGIPMSKQQEKLEKKIKLELAQANEAVKTLQEEMLSLEAKTKPMQEKIKILQIRKERTTGFMKGPIKAALNAQIDAITKNQLKPIQSKISMLSTEIIKHQSILEQNK